MRVCVCVFVELSFAYVCQRRTSNLVWREKTREKKKKVSLVRCCCCSDSTPSAFKTLGDWCVMCMLSPSSKTEDIGCNKEKERRENRGRHAIQGYSVVPHRARAFSCTMRSWYFSLSLSSRHLRLVVLVESSTFFFFLTLVRLMLI